MMLKSHYLVLMLAIAVALSAAALAANTVRAQCGTPNNPVDCEPAEREREEKQQPAAVAPTATFTATPEPTATSTPAPTATHTALPTGTFTPLPALGGLPAAAPGSNDGAWLPLAGLGLIAILGLGYLLLRGPLGLHGEPNAAYRTGNALDVDATLPLVPPFEYEKEDVTAEFDSSAGQVDARDLVELPAPPQADPIGDPIDGASGPLSLHGDTDASYTPGKGVDVDAQVDLTRDYVSRDDPLRTTEQARHRMFKDEPTPTREVTDLEFQQADGASEPERDPSHDGEQAESTDGETDEDDNA